MSREIELLDREVGDRCLAVINNFNMKYINEGAELLIYCTLRSFEKQARLFRRGRSLIAIQERAHILRKKWNRDDLADILIDVGPQYGRIVTYAAPGQSMHNYRLAFDAVPLRDGKPVWGHDTEYEKDLWESYGRIAVNAGLEWAGNWKSWNEYPHCQKKGMDWKDLIGG